MLIGLDGIPLTFPKTGVGHYTAQLAQALGVISPEHEFRFLYPSSFPASSFQFSNNATANVSSLRVPVGALARHWWSVGLPKYLLKHPLTLFHGTNYDIPLWRRCPTVLTIHDLSLFIHPDVHEKRSVRRGRRRLPVMSQQADAVIVPTEAIRDEVCKVLGVNSQKIFVIGEAARTFFKQVDFDATAATREKFRIRDRFLLAVGTIEPRKNIPNLVAAFNKIASPGLQLVIAGGQGWLSGSSMEAIDKSPVRQQIVLTGYLQDEELRDLYSSCEALLYLSLYEGFGLPPIEAMACGAPVVASSIPALVESTGGAALLVDPSDVNAISETVLSVLESDSARSELSERGRKRSYELSWSLAATKTMQVYERVLGVD